MDKEIEIFMRGGQFKKLMDDNAAKLREKYGLKRAEIEILYFLSKSEKSNTSTDIYHQLAMTKGHISQAVFQLVGNGYLIAIPDRKDRRYVHYTLTEKAAQLIREFSEIREKMIQQITAGISEEEMIIFERVAKKMWYNMEKCLE